jgi:hypothetical protein
LDSLRKSAPPPPSAAARVAAIFALYSLALAQPIYQLISQQPEILVARRTEPADLLALVGVLSLLVPGLLSVVDLVLGRLTGWRRTVHLVLLAPAFLALGLQVGGFLPLSDLVVVLVGLGLAGLGLALVGTRPTAQTYLTFLSPAALIVPALFLLHPPIQAVLLRRINTAALFPPQPLHAPIVMVLLDEFPTATLLDPQGQLDAERFPNLASFTREATWYRQATTPCDDTILVIPSLLTSRPPDPSRMPIALDHPKNLFTWLGGTYELRVSEYITLLGPQGQTVNIKEPFPERFGLLLSDMGIVYLHLVLPPNARARVLPPVNHAWKGFGRAENYVESRDKDFLRFIQAMEPPEGGRPPLYFLHILLPHYPFVHLPDGREYDHSGDPVCEGVEDGVWVDSWKATQGRQRHTIQAAFVDRLLGRMFARLKEVGLYDQALVVVTADHGASYRGGLPMRNAVPQNCGDLLFVPLFIKAPGQKQGGISDVEASLLDVLPTMAENLGTQVPWETEGRSLVGRSEEEGSDSKLLLAHINTDNPHFIRVDDWRGLFRALTARNPFRRPGLAGLYEIGPLDQLLGIQPQETPLCHGQRATLDWPGLLHDVCLDREFLPVQVSGRVTPIPPAPRPLAIALNGRVVASTFVEPGGSFSAILPPDALRSGRNTVELFVPEEGRLCRLPQAEERTYVLQEGTVRSDRGEVFSLEDNPLNSLLEELVQEDRRALLKGWLKVSEPGRLVLFARGRSLSSWEMPAGRSAFSYAVPGGTDELQELRLIFLGSDGSATEMQYLSRYRLDPTFKSLPLNRP